MRNGTCGISSLTIVGTATIIVLALAFVTGLLLRPPPCGGDGSADTPSGPTLQSAHDLTGHGGSRPVSTRGSSSDGSDLRSEGSDRSSLDPSARGRGDGTVSRAPRLASVRRSGGAPDARVVTLVTVVEELRRRQAGGWRDGARDAPTPGEEEPEDDAPDYSTIRPHLTDDGETPADVRDVTDILEAPSNVVSGDDVVSLLAWDVRYQEPTGSYLYVLQQDRENKIYQIHRFFCHERRLDILSETCEPVASVFADAGVPVAVDYTEEGVPQAHEAGDIDRSLFSHASTYTEADDLLRYLQEYLDSLRA